MVLAEDARENGVLDAGENGETAGSSRSRRSRSRFT